MFVLSELLEWWPIQDVSLFPTALLPSPWMNWSKGKNGWQLHCHDAAPQCDKNEDESSDLPWSLMTRVWSLPAYWTKPNMLVWQWQIGHLHIYCSCISCCRVKRTMVSLYWIVKGILNSSMVLFNSERIAHSCFMVLVLQEDVLLSWLQKSYRDGMFYVPWWPKKCPLN